MAYQWTIHIDAPPERVFDTLSDVAHHGEWANPNANSPSRRCPAVHRRFAFAITQRKQGGTKDVHYTHTFVLTPEGGGTKLDRSTDGDGNPIVGFLAKPAIMKDGRTSLGNLKQKVESAA